MASPRIGSRLMPPASRPLPVTLALRAAFLLLLCMTGAPPLQAADSDKFLDAFVDTGTTSPGTYAEIVALARAATSKPVETSDILAQWNTRNQKTTHRQYPKPSSAPLRQYLDRLLWATDLSWRYDADRDIILIDFAWNRPDSRPAPELLRTILASDPPPLDFSLRKRIADDDWRRAFDALLLKSEGPSPAWLLRARSNADAPRLITPGAINPICITRMRDDQGRGRVLVLHHQPMFASPGAGTITSYLFDLDGTYLSGAIFSSGHRCSDVSAQLLPDGQTVRVLGLFNGTHPCSSDYILSEDRLTLRSSTGLSPPSAPQP